MTASGPKPRSMPESHFVVQIDTTFNRPQTRAYQRFQQFYPLFNRTLLIAITMGIKILSTKKSNSTLPQNMTL